ncbi:MAG: hypothetical protein GDA68_19390, partial [Nitrospira sp. CR2.1]|nr:hypothetical protein [Nitrospira sp. CR2.1]
MLDVLYLNVNGLGNKLFRLSALITRLLPLVVILAEVKSFSVSVRGQVGAALSQYEHVFFSGPSPRSGGVLILYRRPSVVTLLWNAVDDASSVVHVSTHSDAGLPLSICGVYVHPDRHDVQHVISQIGLHCSVLTPFVVVGDFNSDHSSWGSEIDSQRGSDIALGFAQLGLLCLNARDILGLPTHDRGGVLDLVFVNDAYRASVKLVGEWSVGSDHMALMLVADTVARDNVLPRRWVPRNSLDWKLYAELMEARAQRFLRSHPHLADTASVDDLLDGIHNVMSIMMPVFFTRHPHLERRRSQEAIILQREANTLSRLISRTKDPVRRSGLVVRRRTLHKVRELIERRELRASKLELLSKACSSKRLDWSAIMRLVPPQGVTAVPVNVHASDGTPPDCTQTSLDNLAAAFLKYTVPPQSTDPVLAARAEAVMASLDVRGAEPLLSVVTQLEIDTSLASLHLSLQTGLDGIPEACFRNSSFTIRRWIQRVFTTSLESGVVPERWKASFVTPLYKRGNATLSSAWRPVSAPHPLLKALERIVAQRYYNVLTTNIPIEQSGFLRNRSMLESFIPLLDECRLAIELGTYKPVAFIDINKAYDGTWRAGLLLKLFNLGLPLSLLRWISSLLTGRTYRVRFGRLLSVEYFPTEGLPQGGVLSCILFAVAYSDVAKAVRGATTFLNADDSFFMASGFGPTASLNLTGALVDFWAYCGVWRWLPAPLKSVVVNFRAKAVPCPQQVFVLGNQQLPVMEVVKLLGIQLDAQLSFSEQVRSICDRARRESARIRNFLSQDMLGQSPAASVILALLRTRFYNSIYYGSEFWLWERPRAQRIIDRSAAEVANLILCRHRRSLPIAGVLLEAGLPNAY